ncbi:damage-inducible protein [Candidatus Poribacteria bacterium]|nr:MAG: damage-inducible protein [Candidatus Poribacteria bacterium]
MQRYEQTQLNLELRKSTNPNFQSILDHIDEKSSTPTRKGQRFERLMQRFFLIDPIYQERFSEVYLWREWAELRGHSARDLGIDLVAKEHDGGYCAIQCKCYAPTTRITKADIDSFISESNRPPFTSRIIVDTGGSWGQNALNAINGLQPECQVIRFGDLERSHVNWPDLQVEAPEEITRREPFTLKAHQQDAFDDVVAGFQTADRGKLIMACGTGKTFTALRIAEEIAGLGGRVLYLVPSIALISQAMREWAEQKKLPHSYLCICSDTTAGQHNEDMPIAELEIPVTTDPVDISIQLKKGIHPDKMNVVFCTYHSLPIIQTAQNYDAPAFDIVFCDEAHRTTGIQRPGEDVTHFRLVHNGIQAHKRLYMTATPKLYTEATRSRASQHDIEVFSMDDEETYGPEFHYYPFSKAIEDGQLSDYKVLILAISESEVDAALQSFYLSGGSEISITDATKIVGCWRALQNPERVPDGDQNITPIKSAIAFTNRIADSQRMAHHWNDIIEQAIEQIPEDQRPTDFNCETQHVDGKTPAIQRKAKLEWLRYTKDEECRILSNARCLSEGVDVPALDAVMFMAPRQSHVDIVQAVGRVMRKAPNKNDGYIILPVAIPEGVDPADALDNNDRFATVWSVLRALRSHDDRFNIKINQIDLNRDRPDRIIFDGAGAGTGDEGGEAVQLPLMPLSFPADKIYAKIVEKCGDRTYWEKWAKDVADIFTRLAARIGNLINNPENTALNQEFEKFVKELQATINEAVTPTNAIDMIAQHILTHPIFEALFEDYDFTAHNPVARALQKLYTEFEGYGLENETRDLEGFYESVQKRARGIDNSEGRQKVLIELYNKFFTKALKKEADRLGIVYTPIELVDFILQSVNDILQQEFGRKITDEGIHVLDPFTGTGTFIVRLLQSGLIQPDDLPRKFQSELHAIEMVLLAYYIATINIEEAYRGQIGEESNYVPFNGMVFTDTFNLNPDEEQPTLFPRERMAANNERAEQQQELPIEIIVGNPPWSAGQRSETDDNPNVEYPVLEGRVRKTYVEHSTARSKKNLYDTYKMAIRWASDRINEQGVIAFVTNGSWIDGHADSGIRACLTEEFSSIHVLHLRGNAYTSGERRRAEGGNAFGGGSRAPVAITILVKNPKVTHEGCKIHYREIGDYLTREEKLEALREAVSIKGFSDWEAIIPNDHYDWIDQRSDAFAEFYPLGSDEARDGKADDTVFQLFSKGYKTARDPYIYNFSREVCAGNARLMTQDYLAAISELKEDPTLTADAAARRHSANIKWDKELKNKLKGKKKTEFTERHIRKVVYRPFVATNCYADHTFIGRKYQMGQIFPNSSSENRVICVPGKGTKKSFSVLVTDTVPDVSFNDACQCFPRWRYLQPTNANQITSMDTPERIDNISNTALRAFREYYSDDAITKDDIFDYVYGILHAPSYREQFANDLSKMLPRIPFAPDFRAFTSAGAALVDLHLNYENCQQYPHLIVESVRQDLFWEERPEHFLLDRRGMKFSNDDRTILKINEHVCVSGIPPEAHQYVVNGRTPLEWFMDRYKIKQDRESGIVNDPNGWFENPRDLITAIERIVYVSVETTKILEALPSDVIPES